MYVCICVYMCVYIITCYCSICYSINQHKIIACAVAGGAAAGAIDRARVAHASTPASKCTSKGM